MLGLGIGVNKLYKTYRGGFQFDELTALEAADSNDFTIGWDVDDRGAAGMAISITMKLNSWNGTTFGSQGIIGKTNEWSVHLTNGALYWAVHDESANKSHFWNLSKSDTEAAISPNTYYNFIFRTGANAEGIYIDGVDMTSNSGTNTGFVADENLATKLFIGKAQRLAQLSGSQNFFKGAIDDVVIWKSAALMTVAQLTAYYNSVVVPKITPLDDVGDYNISDDVVAYYKFNSLSDSSGNNHTLSLTEGTSKFV
tara:strand:+ start:355 stop:1116 length:762 start_codon:yes stop_codon:yes gene_type:complete